MQNYLLLRGDSENAISFVTRNNTELLKTVRTYLNDAVVYYHSQQGSHKLDAKRGIQVAIDFKRSYAPHVRSAMSKAKGVIWSYDSGTPTYKNPTKPVKLPDLDTILANMNEALDKIDADSKRPELTAADKLDRSSKSAITGLMNINDDKLSIMLKMVNELSGDELRNLSSVINAISDECTIKLSIRAA